ncbi:MAG: hypothetical protein K2Y32_17050 [Candidatus Obscuribacterales bacterium]|nr:hypothetical protein [Candidatus Obscuribacterales bacterium]
MKNNGLCLRSVKKIIMASTALSLTVLSAHAQLPTQATYKFPKDSDYKKYAKVLSEESKKDKSPKESKFATMKSGLMSKLKNKKVAHTASSQTTSGAEVAGLTEKNNGETKTEDSADSAQK